jgi:hypothetical protein
MEAAVMEENRIIQLENRVTALETKVAIVETDIKHINLKLDKIESNTTWLLRIVIGGFVLAVLGFFIKDKPSLDGAINFIWEAVKHG